MRTSFATLKGRLAALLFDSDEFRFRLGMKSSRVWAHLHIVALCRL